MLTAIVLMGVVAGMLWAATGDILLNSLTEQMWAERISDNAPVGRCVATESSWAANKNTVTSTGCDEPHWAEILGYPVLYRPGQSPPDDNQAAAQAQAACRNLMVTRTLPPDQILRTVRIVPRGYQLGSPLPDQVYVDCLLAHR